ncbi:MULTISPECIES: alanine racemase [Vagococcus]|uniref:Alanine racemase n=1 Tax=Vagococcus fluvialis bH819 TaxID=1255619 RepID=A0A1X6WNL0_9ENTE|nr:MULTISPECIES: alanine racemase [Vagococcus]SLM85904.1 Alanine racemase [Vagococcus fluvialis bH819]HCM88271.1 alanine racemase [Vagococcus sp.]
MIPSTYRSSRLKINLDAIDFNIKEEIKRLNSSQTLYAVVKANGYGHGAVATAKTAIKAGARGLCVSNLNEALELREAEIKEPIIVLSYVEIEYINKAIQHDITLTATSLEWLMLLDKKVKSPIKIHLKIDTGMGRIGLREESEMKEAKKILENNPLIEFEGIFTHFSKADSQDFSYVELQKKRFVNALDIFGREMKYIHTSNSATALWHGAWESNLIRFGDAMYGMNPSGNELEEPFKLKQALSLETKIIHIKKLPRGEKIGYGATYETLESEWIATLPIGYADGLVRDFQGFHVLVDGKKCPIVGRICMDQCMIRLDQEYKTGTIVTIFGENKGTFNSIQSGAEFVKTINYEITCGLTDRLPRIYIKNGQEVELN